MSFRPLLAAAAVLALSAPLVGCSALSRPDAITIQAEPPAAKKAPAPAPMPAPQAANAAAGNAPAAGG